MIKLGIYSVSDRYIEFLRNDNKLSIVFDNKENCRSHTRKYVGVAFHQNGFNYFIPFSSPKNSDYIVDETGNKIIRNSIIPIIRMVTNDTISGNPELKGTLKLSNMIPVPESELTYYDINSETDANYKAIVSKEYDFIKSNAELILKNASVIYNQKIKEDTLFISKSAPNYIKNTVDFRFAESKCNMFIQEQVNELFSYKKITAEDAEALRSSGIKFTIKNTPEGIIAQFLKSDMPTVEKLFSHASGQVL